MNDLKASFVKMAGLLFVLSIAACSGEKGKESPEAGILVTNDWLQDHLNDPDMVILHAGTVELYDSAHIPGARLIIPSDFTVEKDGNRNQMPPADSIVELLRQVGVDNTSKIVLYHESAGLLTRTARVFVTLDFLGLGDRTFVLNGGLPGWLEENRETKDLSSEFTEGNLDITAVRDVVIDWEELERQRWSNDLVVIDVRRDEEYYGTPETDEEAAEGGHIEGAYFLPYQELLMNDSPYKFKTDKELEELFRMAEADPEKETVVYCGSGVRASVSYLVARHLGYPVLLYDGSYEEWTELDLPLTGPVVLPETNN